MKKIALCAGEASGDQLGAGLIAAMLRKYSKLEFVGIGGPLMRDAGMQCWFDMEELSVMGLVEVLKHLPRLLKLRKQFFRQLEQAEIDLYLGIDAPDFNLGIETRLKAKGLKTAHYVSPSLWAWRAERIEKMPLAVDLMLCLFPFETELYQRVGVSAVHVGHPLAELFPTERQADGARALFGLPLDIPVLALLPGSRIGEVERLAPVFLETAAQLKARIPRLITLAPMASNAVRRVLEPLLEPRHGVRLIDRQAHMVMRAADAALLASGTATLECALARTPMVVAYKVSKLTEWMVRLMGGLRTPWFSLPNHLEGGFVVPEFSQRDANPGVLSEALEPLFEPVHRAPQLAAFDRIQKVLRKDGNARAADAVLNLLFH